MSLTLIGAGALLAGFCFAVGFSAGVVASVLVVNRLVVWLEKKGLLP